MENPIISYVMRKGNKYASNVTQDITSGLIMTSDLSLADKLRVDQLPHYKHYFGYDILAVTNTLSSSVPTLTNIVNNTDNTYLSGNNTEKQLKGNFSINSHDNFGKVAVLNIAIQSDISSGNVGIVFNNGYPTTALFGQTPIIQGTHTYKFIIDWRNYSDSNPSQGLRAFLQIGYFTGNLLITGCSMYVYDGNNYLMTSGSNYITNYQINDDSTVNLTVTSDFNRATYYNQIDAIYIKGATGYALNIVNSVSKVLSDDEITKLVNANAGSGGGSTVDPSDPSMQPATPGFNQVGSLDA